MKKVEVRQNNAYGYIASIKEGEKEAIVYIDYLITKMFDNRVSTELTRDELLEFDYDELLELGEGYDMIPIQKLEDDEVVVSVKIEV